MEAELAPLIQALREATTSATSTPEPEASAADVPPPPAGRTATDGTGLLAGGIGLLIVGGGLLGAGVGLVVPEPRVDPDAPLDLITTRPVGYACLAGAVAAVATGAVLTALAVEQRRRATWSLAPWLDPRRAGITIGWRF